MKVECGQLGVVAEKPLASVLANSAVFGFILMGYNPPGASIPANTSYTLFT